MIDCLFITGNGNGNLNLFGQPNNYPAPSGRGDFFVFFSTLFCLGKRLLRRGFVLYPVVFNIYTVAVKPGIISKYTIKDQLFTVKIEDLIGRKGRTVDLI